PARCTCKRHGSTAWCLTIHSSRRHFAARLNSSVRWRSMDKRREREALKHVFGNYAATAEERERPDFRIVHPNLQHGVEVTEMYPSLIDAKLQNLGGYTSGLLDGTQPLHRADREKLRIETI